MPDTSLIRARTGFDVVRYAEHAPQVRVDPVDGGVAEGVLFGHFSVFDRFYEINSALEGNFVERVAPGAFTHTFTNDVQRCWFEHGQSATLDRHSLGTIEVLREDEVGAYYEVRLFDGLPQFFVDGLRAGEYGASFRMRILGQDIVEQPRPSDYNPRGLPEVTITRVQCPEFGPVSIGASPYATAGLRCATDDYYERAGELPPVESLNSSDVESVPGGAGGDGEEPNQTNRALAAMHALRLHKE